MSIFAYPKLRIVDVWCNGCGEHVRLDSSDWYAGRRMVQELGWLTTVTVYRWGEGKCWEHFCSRDCMDED